MASEAIKLADRGNVQTDVRAINVSDFKYEVKLNLDIITVARESIGPLPSSFASSQPPGLPTGVENSGRLLLASRPQE